MHNVAQVALRAHAAQVARRRLLLRHHVRLRLRVLRRQKSRHIVGALAGVSLGDTDNDDEL